MKKISDYLIVSDMDGTLLNDDGIAPKRNIDAIERFIRKGGRFSIATGRSRALMLDVVQDFPINAPCVIYNGGAIYDFKAGKVLWETFLPEGCKAFVEQIIQEVQGIGIMVVSEDSYYQLNMERDFSNYLVQRRSDHFKQSSVEGVDGSWYKVLILVEPDRSNEVFTYLAAKKFPGVRFVRTNQTLIEMLPEHSNKGAALKMLAHMGYVDQENLVAIGDYYNDLEMIEMAGLGVTLSTSPDDLKTVADLVVGDCNHGAVADLIEHMEKLCGA